MSASLGTRLRVPLLYLCFFLSGIAGLIYQVVWSRYLTLFLGGTGRAQVIILGSFMGGLALGAWLFGRRADSAKSPLRLYAYLELGIGLCGLAYPSLFEPIRGLFLALAGSLGLGPGAVSLAGVAICAITVLLPTTLMGGTLPVLSRFMIENETSVGRHVSRLYYLNSFGAVFGSIIGGFSLVPLLGLPHSMYSAAFLNIEVAFVALLLNASLANRPAPAPSAAADAVPFESDVAAGLGAARTALIVIGISGFVSFVYEVAWIRLLTTVLGTSSFSFSIMLAAFIGGITLGSFILSLRKSERGWFRILGWCELGAGITALLSILAYQRLPLMLNHWRSIFANEESAYTFYQIGAFALCFLAMLAPTVFIGATVPAATRVVADAMGTLGRRVGSVFAVNTFGTLAGALCAGFFLLPALGVKGTVELAVALNLLLGLWVIFADRTKPRPRRMRPATALALAVAAAAIYFIAAPDWDQRTFTAAPYRMRRRMEDYDAFRKMVEARKLLYYRDGKDASIAVTSEHDEMEGIDSVTLRVNGKPDASTGHDVVTQLMVGHLPMLIHGDPKDALVVGLGSGMTAGAVASYPNVDVTVVELIPEVVEAARFFGEWNGNVLDRKNTKIVVQDAKTFMQLTPKKYDVISLEPTNPWIAGVAGLFSKEFLLDARARLKPGGVVLQWMHIYEMDDHAVWSVLRTFNEIYPYSTIFVVGVDMAIVGSPEPFAPDFARMEALAADPGVAQSLRIAHVEGILPILSMQAVAKNDTPGPYVRMAWTNSDLVPLLEHVAVRSFFRRTFAESMRTLDRRGLPPAQGGLWLSDYKPTTRPPESVFQSWFDFNYRSVEAYSDYHVAWTRLWERYYPTTADMKVARARAWNKDRTGRRIMLEDPAIADRPESLLERARIAHADYLTRTSFVGVDDPTGVAELQEAAAKAYPRYAAEQLLARGDLLVDSGKIGEALESYERALAAASDSPSANPSKDGVRLRIGATQRQAGRLDEAEATLREIPEDGRGIRGIRDARHFHLCRIIQDRERGKAPSDASNPPIEWFGAPAE